MGLASRDSWVGRAEALQKRKGRSNDFSCLFARVLACVMTLSPSLFLFGSFYARSQTMFAHRFNTSVLTHFCPFALSLSLPLSLSLSLSFLLPVCLPACLPVCVSVCLCVCLSVSIHVCVSVIYTQAEMHTYMYIHLERVLQLFKSGHEVGNPTVQAPANQYLPLLLLRCRGRKLG